MNDLSQKGDGKRVKDNDVEVQLRARMLEVCCEERAERLAQEETRAMGEVTRGRRVQWVDLTEETQGEEQSEMAQENQLGRRCGRGSQRRQRGKPGHRREGSN